MRKSEVTSDLSPSSEPPSDKGSEDSVNEASDHKQNDTVECTVTTEEESKEQKPRTLAGQESASSLT